MPGAFRYPDDALILAPLSGFTDLAYRRAARRGGCRFAFTEMVDAASLAYANGHGETLLRRGEEEDFFAAQLVGADPELLKRACARLAGYELTLLDFNLGCPVPKVVKKGAGAALGQNIPRAHRCFATLASETDFQLTAKLRILHRTDPSPTLDLCAGLVESGATALTVHGRTRENFYSGEVSFDVIAAVREAFPQVQVIANGGVHSQETYRIMRERTGGSQVMLAQGAMGNPWLFRELSGAHTEPPTLAEWREMVRYHVGEMALLYGEDSAMRQARKIVHDYLKGRGFPAGARAAASTLTTLAELEELLAAVRPVTGSPSGRKLRV